MLKSLLFVLFGGLLSKYSFTPMLRYRLFSSSRWSCSLKVINQRPESLSTGATPR